MKDSLLHKHSKTQNLNKTKSKSNNFNNS